MQYNRTITNPDIVSDDAITIIFRTFFGFRNAVHETANHINPMIATADHNFGSK
jgi:hypothetical protein